MDTSEGNFGVKSPSSFTDDLKERRLYGWMETERRCLIVNIHVSSTEMREGASAN
jgi:hypothetical protein